MGQGEKLIEILMDVFEADRSEIVDDATPDDIEMWDSVTHMDLIARFEDEFDVNFDVEEITEMETIGIIKDMLRQHGVDV